MKSIVLGMCLAGSLSAWAAATVVSTVQDPQSRQVTVTFNLSEDAKEFVATKGYDMQFGARPLKRAIQNYIEDGISDLIVNGNMPLGSIIHITLKDNELAFS